MMEDKEGKFFELLGDLHELTEVGKVKWQETSSLDRFTTLLKSGGVQIEKLYNEHEDEAAAPYYEATLLNSNSLPIQSLNSHASVLNGSSVLHDLFKSAQFNARSGANVLGDLLTEVHGIAAR